MVLFYPNVKCFSENLLTKRKQLFEIRILKYDMKIIMKLLKTIKMIHFNIATKYEPVRKYGRKPFCGVLGPYFQMRKVSLIYEKYIVYYDKI